MPKVLAYLGIPKIKKAIREKLIYNIFWESFGSFLYRMHRFIEGF